MLAPRTDRVFGSEQAIVEWLSTQRPGAQVTIQRALNGVDLIYRFIYETDEVIGHVAFFRNAGRFTQHGFQYEREVEEEEFDIEF